MGQMNQQQVAKQQVYNALSELDDMKKMKDLDDSLEKLKPLPEPDVIIEDTIEKTEKMIAGEKNNLSYNGYDDWLIIADTMKNKNLRPAEHFPKMVQEQLDIDRTKFDVTILNHSITDSNGNFWITLTLGIKPIKKQRMF